MAIDNILVAALAGALGGLLAGLMTRSRPAWRPRGGPGAFSCPVCGARLREPPRDHAICPCCGTHFGYDDATRSHAALRGRWLAGGARWWSVARPAPPGWSAADQLAAAGLPAGPMTPAAPRPDNAPR